MPEYSFTEPRLFVSDGLEAGATLTLGREQSHYLLNVMRVKDGEEVLLFNGRDGEWRARVSRSGRKEALAEVCVQTRPQTRAGMIDYCFAPLKQARLDYMVQKAVEMGAGHLRPVLTQHTQVRKLNTARLNANAVEAAEQCGILSIPHVHDPVTLEKFLKDLPASQTLIFCDERADGRDALNVLKAEAGNGRGISLLIGPEGGFSQAERDLLRAREGVVILGLGPRILRADTAAVAALAVVQAAVGDWRQPGG